jgi:predicted alpha-1,2-mannosidase
MNFSKSFIVVFLISFQSISCTQAQNANKRPVDYVNRFIGSGLDGGVTPVVSVPFGMMQMGVDTRMYRTGYHYTDSHISGVSLVHKSGAGCGDFLDILFAPLNSDLIKNGQSELSNTQLQSSFSHKNESAKPGYYSVYLDDWKVKTELTATDRAGLQKYSFDNQVKPAIMIDLKYGSQGACTIVKEDDVDTVKAAYIEIVNDSTVKGYRISNGFAPKQHVYFYAQFSKPFKSYALYSKNLLQIGKANSLMGKDVKAVFYFDTSSLNKVSVKTAVSPVDMDAARMNLEAEIAGWDFNGLVKKSQERWNDELKKIIIETKNESRKEVFYSAIYSTLMYPSLYSDVDGRFRGPDFKVHPAVGFPYYGQVVGVWDTFRAAVPLLTFLKPTVVNDYIKMFLEHYRIFGQLPIWVLSGEETFQMLGLHTLPIIADSYYKHIGNFNAEYAFQAMKKSAMKDTIGYSMRYFVGLKNYKKYGYVPADLEMESVARTLEYAYDDWTLAQMAKMLKKKDDYNYFINRAKSYQNVFDKKTSLMRGRFSNGTWRTPFDPFSSNHRRDDYCEGNAWQWSFFVPHDVIGLAKLMGGKDKLIARLDSLFTLQSNITGANSSGDISGLIGQYAHGNEPSHHTAYMYNYLGQPWKTQKYVHEILTTLYDNTPNGLCGNDDTGQMSAWYVLSSMGFYPVRHGDGSYVIGTPLFDKTTLTLPSGEKLEMSAENLSDKNMYIQAVYLNGKLYTKNFFDYEVLSHHNKIKFVMGATPNKKWGADPKDAPGSLTTDKY